MIDDFVLFGCVFLGASHFKLADLPTVLVHQFVFVLEILLRHELFG